MNKYRFTCLVGVVLLGLVLSGSARADSFTYDSIVFTGSVTGTTATLTIQCTDAKACGNFYLGDVTLRGFNYSGTSTLVSAPAGYSECNCARMIRRGGHVVAGRSVRESYADRMRNPASRSVEAISSGL